MRANINPPSLPPGAPNRVAGCSFAVEPSFQALAEAAEQAGWTSDEVSFALFDLAVHRIMAMNDDDGTTVYEAAAFALKQLNRT